MLLQYSEGLDACILKLSIRSSSTGGAQKFSFPNANYCRKNSAFLPSTGWDHRVFRMHPVGVASRSCQCRQGVVAELVRATTITKLLVRPTRESGSRGLVLTSTSISILSILACHAVSAKVGSIVELTPCRRHTCQGRYTIPV